MASKAAQALKLVTYPHPVLRQKCTKVAEEDVLGRHMQNLIRDMLATVRLEEGLGLAAPQVRRARTRQAAAGKPHEALDLLAGWLH